MTPGDCWRISALHFLKNGCPSSNCLNKMSPNVRTGTHTLEFWGRLEGRVLRYLRQGRGYTGDWLKLCTPEIIVHNNANHWITTKILKERKWTEWLKKQRFTLSKFWSMEIQDLGTTVCVTSGGSSFSECLTFSYFLFVPSLSRGRRLWSSLPLLGNATIPARCLHNQNLIQSWLSAQSSVLNTPTLGGSNFQTWTGRQWETQAWGPNKMWLVKGDKKKLPHRGMTEKIFWGS